MDAATSAVPTRPQLQLQLFHFHLPRSRSCKDGQLFIQTLTHLSHHFLFLFLPLSIPSRSLLPARPDGTPSLVFVQPNLDPFRGSYCHFFSRPFRRRKSSEGELKKIPFQFVSTTFYASVTRLKETRNFYLGSCTLFFALSRRLEYINLYPCNQGNPARLPDSLWSQSTCALANSFQPIPVIFHSVSFGRGRTSVDSIRWPVTIQRRGTRTPDLIGRDLHTACLRREFSLSWGQFCM